MAGLKQTLNGYTNHVMHLPPKSYAFGRTMKEKKPEEDRKPKVLYQNYVYVSEDDEDDSLRKSSAKRLSASRDTLYPEMTRKVFNINTLEASILKIIYISDSFPKSSIGRRI